ncbi:hypothetical protein JTB14_030296 [Gonioctena quinquepunctata]|nr:hypothetical protein JTB14_030296 [Gonioctena quinquepunctata]
MESKDGNKAKDASLQIILQQLNALTQSMTEIRNLLLAQNEKIESCLAQVTVLRDETDTLKSKVQNLESKMQETNLEETYNEMRMRFEPDEVARLINELILPHTVAINHITRLERPKTDHNRPAKVELSSGKEVVTVLRNTSKILRSKYPRIRIKSDKIPRQMKQLGTLYDDLNDQKASGVPNLAIRYVNNIPKIVTVSDYRQGNPKRARDEEVSPRQNPPKVSRALSRGGANTDTPPQHSKNRERELGQT